MKNLSFYFSIVYYFRFSIVYKFVDQSFVLDNKIIRLYSGIYWELNVHSCYNLDTPTHSNCSLLLS